MPRRYYILAVVSLSVVVAGTACFLAISFGSSPTALIKRAWGDFSGRFAGLPEADVILDIKFDKQDHALSCEAADLKMALAYRGVAVTESQLLADIGTDPTPKRVVDGQTVWGDPQKGFVGNVDGRMLQDGYGVYWKPVAAAASRYRRASVITGETPAELAAHIAEGNPVIAWSYLGSGHAYSWRTPAGDVIEGIYSEHPVVVKGFKGPASEPEGFFFIDPLYGDKYLTTSDFMLKWGKFGGGGIVIH